MSTCISVPGKATDFNTPVVMRWCGAGHKSQFPADRCQHSRRSNVKERREETFCNLPCTCVLHTCGCRGPFRGCSSDRREAAGINSSKAQRNLTPTSSKSAKPPDHHLTSLDFPSDATQESFNILQSGGCNTCRVCSSVRNCRVTV